MAAGKGKLALTIEVNATREAGVDGLQGEEDLETDGTGLGGWGGLGGHVSLELRNGTRRTQSVVPYGVWIYSEGVLLVAAGWIVSPHVQHLLSADMKSAEVNVTIEVGGQQSGTGFLMNVSTLTYAHGVHAYRQSLSLSVLRGLRAHLVPLQVTFVDLSTNMTVGASEVNCPDLGLFCSGADATIRSPALWSPQSPAQHAAIIQLIDAAGNVMDTVSSCCAAPSCL